MEVDILGVDISGVDILGVDILGLTHSQAHTPPDKSTKGKAGGILTASSLPYHGVEYFVDETQLPAQDI